MPRSPSSSPRDTLTLRTPPSWQRDLWREGLPLGNGVTGALVYGCIADETIMLTHAGLWHGGRREPMPDISKTLMHARALLDAKRYAEANIVSRDALQAAGFNPLLPCPCPLADIRIQTAIGVPFRNYRRSLNMAIGEVYVGWLHGNTRFHRKAFVSRRDDALICELGASNHSLDVRISLQLHDSGDSDTGARRLVLGDSLNTRAGRGRILYAGTHEDKTDFGAVLHILSCDGIQTPTPDGQIHITGASRVLLVVRTFIGGRRDERWRKLTREIRTLPLTYAALLRRHRPLHATLYRSADIHLAESANVTSNEELLLAAYEGEASNALLEKLWRFGRYLFIAGTGATHLPFPLYGLWGGRYDLPWSQHVGNENIQMIYWHSFTGGLHQAMDGFVNYYLGLMDDFRENARKMFGCGGIYCPAYTAPGIGLPAVHAPVILNWIGGAGWLARHFHDYYRMTGNRELLRTKLLPFMVEAARFYQDYLVKTADGGYRIYPSVSPENTPANLMPDGIGDPMDHACPTVINATMDVAIIQELLTNCITDSTEAGLHMEQIPAWRDILLRLPSYHRNSDGAIREWLHPDLKDQYCHRHLSHLYPVFPGNEVGSTHPLWSAFERATDRRKLGGQSGWSLAHMACLYARFGRSKKAIACLDVLTRACLQNNFLTVHNDWRRMGLTLDMGGLAPIQLDANMGFVNAMQEMLLGASDRQLHFLPACPDRFPRGSVRNFHFSTGTVSFEWNIPAKMFQGRLAATRNTDIVIQLPHFCPASRVIRSPRRVTPAGKRGLFHVRVAAGTSLQL